MRGVEHIPWMYDTICAIAEWRGLARWRRWLVAGARGRTLDLGCGTGRNLPLYARDVRPIGVDPVADSLARARRRSGGRATPAGQRALRGRSCSHVGAHAAPRPQRPPGDRAQAPAPYSEAMSEERVCIDCGVRGRETNTAHTLIEESPELRHFLEESAASARGSQ